MGKTPAVASNAAFEKRDTHLSVVGLAPSAFHSPQVSSRAVRMKRHRLMKSSTPSGPKKYGRTSMSPAGKDVVVSTMAPWNQDAGLCTLSPPA